MYKMLMFLKRNEEDRILEIFSHKILNKLRILSNKTIELADIDGALLSEEKYYKFCEIDFPTREELDKFFQSPEGKELTKDIAGLNNYVSVFFADYEVKK